MREETIKEVTKTELGKNVMFLNKLSQEEKKIVLSCIRAIADGPFIENDWELHSRIGVHRPKLHRIIKTWYKTDDSINDSDNIYVIHRVMNEVCNGIRFSNADWQLWFHVKPKVIRTVFDKWKRLS